jgi:NO-binding membrane sensor protein with MHYT domain
MELNHFTYGWVNPALAYGISFLGSLLGLMCTARARGYHAGTSPTRWLVLAAVSIGGTGIWLMHFMAMLGFTVVDDDIRFDLSITAASAVAAIGVVGVGLFIIGTREFSVVRLLVGGLFTGGGVAIMHYLGMSAMRVHGDVDYDPLLVAASVVVAVVAATVALWFTIAIQTPGLIALAAAIMAVAVCGMHYTGMAALHVHQRASTAPLGGSEPFSFVMPVILVAVVAVLFVLYEVLTSPSADEYAGGRISV